MAKTWSEFYPWVMPDVPGCPPLMAEDAIREAAVEYCDATLAYQVDLDPISIVADQRDYVFTLADGLLPVTVKGATVDDEPLISMTADEVARILGGQWATATGTAEYFHQTDEYTVRIYRIPTEALADGLVLKVAVKPAPDAEEVDDKLFNFHRRGICFGALSRLMKSPNKPYTNLALSQHYAQAFQSEIGFANNKQARQFSRGPLRSRPVNGVEL